jgi:3-methyladenine DNA glycosylase Tag
MTDFETILNKAQARAGGEAELAQHLPVPKTPDELRAVADDRYLSLISLRVFQAGLKHSMVAAKLMADRRLIRHFGKLRSVRDNAAAILALEQEVGGLGAYLADWPGPRIVELWADMAKRFKQMGGISGPYFLRLAGKDTFILSGDVVRALGHWDAVEGNPKTKAGQRQAQEVFNRWAEESGRPLCQLSMILARSVD